MIDRSSPVLTTGIDAVFHTALLFSLFLLFVGHNEPGGGFVGGLVAGAAFVLRYASEGPSGVRRMAGAAPESLFGLGLLTAATTGAVPAVLGGAFLESSVWEADLPALGVVKLSSTLFFDIGVYLVVVGLVLMVLGVLGEEGESAGAGSPPDVDPGPVPPEETS